MTKELRNTSFVTTFNKQIYETSAKNLISSFLINCSKIADLNLFTEEVIIESNYYVKQHSLDDNTILFDFLDNNREIIPIYYGGLWEPCNCSSPEEKKQKLHKRGCKYHYFNRCASKWFRKVLSIYLASQLNYEYLIWIDADCLFIKKINIDIILNAFKDKSIFYLKAKRRYTETGLYGIKLDDNGKNFINDYINCYLNGIFRKLERWDDCSTFDYTLKKYKNYAHDIALKQHEKGQVIPGSLFKSYIIHNKGKHAKLGFLR